MDENTKGAAAPQVVADERAAFEAVFPVPEGVERVYRGKNAGTDDLYSSRHNSFAADELNIQWKAWKARAGFHLVVPAGWKLVPEDPTGNMYRAADRVDNEAFAGGSAHGASDEQIWRAMYESAPAVTAALAAAPVQAQEPIGYINPAFLTERRSEFEQNGTVMFARKCGECTSPIYGTAAPVQPVAVPDINTPVFQALLANYFNAQHATLSASSAAVYSKAIVAEKALIAHINSRPLAAPAAQGDAKDVENERAAFESSAKARGYKLDRTGSGCYRDDQLQDAWNMTQDTLAQRAYAYGNFRAAIAAKAAS